MTSVKDIISITEDQINSLHDVGICTVQHLLQAGSIPSSRLRLSDETRIGEAELTELVHRADLLRVKDIDPKQAHLLYECGVTTIPKLAYRNVHILHEDIAQYNSAHNIVKHLPTVHDVEAWVADAKRLPKMIRH